MLHKQLWSVALATVAGLALLLAPGNSPGHGGGGGGGGHGGGGGRGGGRGGGGGWAGSSFHGHGFNHAAFNVGFHHNGFNSFNRFYNNVNRFNNFNRVNQRFIIVRVGTGPFGF